MKIIENDTIVAALFIVILFGAVTGFVLSVRQQDVKLRHTCSEALKNVSSSDTLRVYKLQPLCIP